MCVSFSVRGLEHEVVILHAGDVQHEQEEEEEEARSVRFLCALYSMLRALNATLGSSTLDTVASRPLHLFAINVCIRSFLYQTVLCSSLS